MAETAKIRAPLIDCHFHTWRIDQPLTETAWHVPPTDAPVDAYLKEMQRHDILFGVVAAASIHGDYNDYVRASIGAHPRLRATAVLSPRTDIYRMERMKAEGFVGVRLMWSLHDDIPDVNSADYRLHLRRVADLGWHAHLVDKPHRLPAAIRAVEASGARLVIDHMGHLQTPEGANDPAFREILAAIDRGNTWVKVSCRFRFDDPELADACAAQLIRAGGGDRILWGSDWPFADFEGRVTYDDVLADYYHLVPDAEMRRRIDETGLKFYFD